jgi:hypothetical protein
MGVVPGRTDASPGLPYALPRPMAVAPNLPDAVPELPLPSPGPADRSPGPPDAVPRPPDGSPGPPPALSPGPPGPSPRLPEVSPELVEKADYTRQGGAEAMARLLDRRPDLDAVFVASDLMAAGALLTLRERGRRVPEDVAVVGFDDLTSIAEATDPPLTTVHQDVEGMGRLMAGLLFDHTGSTAEPDTASVVVPTRLVLRTSA